MDTARGFTLSWSSCLAEVCWICWVCGSPEQLKELFPTHCSHCQIFKLLNCIPRWAESYTPYYYSVQIRQDRRAMSPSAPTLSDL